MMAVIRENINKIGLQVFISMLSLRYRIGKWILVELTHFLIK